METTADPPTQGTAMETATVTAIGSATSGKALAPPDLAELVAAFHRDGVVVMPGAAATVAPRLRELAERWYADPAIVASHGSGDISITRAFELDRAYRDLLVLEPIISAVEAILGHDCHMTSQNLLRTPPGGRAVDTWHVDDGVIYPVPEGTARHPWAPPPVYLHVFVMLSDHEDESHGPTQVVPGSHLSGRPVRDDLTFEGRGPVSVLGKAGDVYFHHHQTWHRGAPNRSQRTRCVVGTGYGRRWASQRLWPFGDYRMPAQVLVGADERLLRVLGRHPKGPYA
jgi:ectoine hydroxylase-related dioxygenase (phytanoyl-CoA dioxygenase family)